MQVSQTFSPIPRVVFYALAPCSSKNKTLNFFRTLKFLSQSNEPTLLPPAEYGAKLTTTSVASFDVESILYRSLVDLFCVPNQISHHEKHSRKVMCQTLEQFPKEVV